MSVSADYNDGYTYTGFGVVEDSNMGFSMPLTKSIDPLDTIGMRYLIECPQEVEENTEAPVFVIITVEGVKYHYTLR